MKNIILLTVCSVFVFMISSCDGDLSNNEFICSIQQMQNRFAQTTCIGEELITGCSNLVCRSTDDAELRKGNFNDCNFIDCETLECELLVTPPGEPVFFVDGFMTELAISATNELPIVLFVVDETESPFDCIFIAVD